MKSMALLSELTVRDEEDASVVGEGAKLEEKQEANGSRGVWDNLEKLREKYQDLGDGKQYGQYSADVRDTLKSAGITSLSESEGKDNLWALASTEMAFRKWGPDGSMDLNKLRRANDGTVRTYDAVYDALYRNAQGSEATKSNDTYSAINDWVEHNAALAVKYSQERAKLNEGMDAKQEERRLFSGWQKAERAKFDQNPTNWTTEVRDRFSSLSQQRYPVPRH